MTRRRNPSAAERAIVQLADVLANPNARRADLGYLEFSADAALPQPELMAVRHLGLEHLGCWVELTSLPETDAQKLEPSAGTTIGRLVGIRPGVAGERISGRLVATRVLVLQQGSASGPVEVAVARPVSVAPREWS